MIFYWLIVIIILLLSRAIAGEFQQKFILIFFVSLLFVFFAFRVGGTPDYFNYENTFDSLHSGRVDQDIKYEVGFQWLCILLPSYRAFLIVFTAFYFGCVYYAFEKLIKPSNWFLSFVILFSYIPFVLGNMSGVRSGFVTCFFFLAIICKYQIVKQRPFATRMVLSLAFMLLAYSFHRSTIVLIPLLFIPSKPLRKSTLNVIYVIVAFIVLYIFANVNQINAITSRLVSDWFGDDYYDVYFEGVRQIRFTFFSFIKMLVVAALMVMTLRLSNDENDKIKIVLLRLTAIFYFITILPDLGLTARLYYYFAFPCVIGTSYVAEKAISNTKTLYYACVFVYIFWQLYNFFISPILIYYQDYQNILF